MEDELGAKWRWSLLCSTDQWSGHPYISNAPKKRGLRKGGEGGRARDGKIEENTEDKKSIVISEEKSKLKMCST